MTGMPWTCPFCARPQVITESNRHIEFVKFELGTSKHGSVGMHLAAIRCSDPGCNEVTVGATFGTTEWGSSSWKLKDKIDFWRLRPESSSVPQPPYIPAPLVEDYYEACLIREKSPKAAATLARRCLQGMIRDFCNISKSRLVDEIKELKTRLDSGDAPKGVQPETVDAIDAVREIGNIGAHMEKDINLIIAVEPGEAQALIELIEMLFEEWYVARYKREQRLASVKALADQKNAEIKQARMLGATPVPTKNGAADPA